MWPGSSHLVSLVLVFLIHKMGISCPSFAELLGVLGKQNLETSKAGRPVVPPPPCPPTITGHFYVRQEGHTPPTPRWTLELQNALMWKGMWSVPPLSADEAPNTAVDLNRVGFVGSSQSAAPGLRATCKFYQESYFSPTYWSYSPSSIILSRMWRDLVSWRC